MYFFVVVAAAAAVYFASAALRQPRPGVIVAAIAWLLYAAYEVLIANGTLCDANCNIRVDLILIWPLVWIASLFGLFAPGQWTGTGKALGAVSAFSVVFLAALWLYIVLVENPAAERAAVAKGCDAQNQGGPECPPAGPSAGSASEAK
jgi:hypothetical protein